MNRYLLASIAVMVAGMQIGHAQMKPLGVQTYICSAYGERCVIPVYASTNSAGQCELRIDFGEIDVPQSQVSGGKKIRVVWFIFPADTHDPNEYYFASFTTPPYGVDIQGNTANDFANPDKDAADLRRFKWDSVHNRSASLPYKLNAVRKTPSGVVTNCIPVDPKVVNN
jgi:hypothetical protein